MTRPINFIYGGFSFISLCVDVSIIFFFYYLSVLRTAVYVACGYTIFANCFARILVQALLIFVMPKKQNNVLRVAFMTSQVVLLCVLVLSLLFLVKIPNGTLRWPIVFICASAISQLCQFSCIVIVVCRTRSARKLESASWAPLLGFDNEELLLPSSSCNLPLPHHSRRLWTASWGKEMWAKLEYVRGVLGSRLHSKDKADSGSFIDDLKEVTALLLQLIAGEDVAVELQGVLLEDPTTLLIFLPQLASYAFSPMTQQTPGAKWLGKFLLDQSSKHLKLSLRLYWHLQAFGTNYEAKTAAESSFPVLREPELLGNSLKHPTDKLEFHQSVIFFDKIAAISQELSDRVGKDPSRAGFMDAELQYMLSIVQGELMPFRLAHFPLGGHCYRICSIYIEGCKSLPTKDRVPIFVCLEVIEDKLERFESSEVWKEHKMEENSSIASRKRQSPMLHPDSEDEQYCSLLRQSRQFNTPPNSLASSPDQQYSLLQAVEFPALDLDAQRMVKTTYSKPEHPEGTILKSLMWRKWPFKRKRSHQHIHAWEIEEEEAWSDLAIETEQLVSEQRSSVPTRENLSFSYEDQKVVGEAFKDHWQAIEDQARSMSAFGSNESWKLLPLIIKTHADLRQEEIVHQIISAMSRILSSTGHGWLRPYTVFATSSNTGIIEAIPNTQSLHDIRKQQTQHKNLKQIFIKRYGIPRSKSFKKAQQNFISSLAAYSIVCYLLQLKDRHNANILLDNAGHIIHVDFGFVFGYGPGRIKFEKAPFKLTSDFVELMGGPRSLGFLQFRSLCCKIFLDLRRERENILLLVDIAANAFPELSCFQENQQGHTVSKLRKRFVPELSKYQCLEHINMLIDESLDNWRTAWYDKYQWWCVGIF